MAYGLRCPACGHRQTSVKDSRPTEIAIRRRRLCLRCGARFTTIEVLMVERDNAIAPVAAMGLVDRLENSFMEAVAKFFDALGLTPAQRSQYRKLMHRDAQALRERSQIDVVPPERPALPPREQ